jgi:hypothetical protein
MRLSMGLEGERDRASATTKLRGLVFRDGD